MKKSILAIIAAIGISACAGTTENSSSASDSSDASTHDTLSTSQTLCFQKLEGTSKQDTATLSLNINGANVTGEFDNRPFEKDSRKGKIQGTFANNVIKGVWVYMQEGMTDTLPIEFKLTGDKLVQKNYTVDPKTGREVFSDGSVFNIEFEKINCN